MLYGFDSLRVASKYNFETVSLLQNHYLGSPTHLVVELDTIIKHTSVSTVFMSTYCAPISGVPTKWYSVFLAPNCVWKRETETHSFGSAYEY